MIPRTPIWLDEASDIRELLGAVVDRFDAQSGESRARDIVLRAEAHVRGLIRNDADADQTWALVRELQKLGVLTIQGGPRNPYDSPWTGAKLRFATHTESTLRDWLNRPAAPNPWDRWRAAVARHADVFADRGAALATRRIVIAGRSDEEAVQALAGLARVDRPATLRQLSAHAFWGDSKVLDERGDLIAALFPQLVVRERKVIVSIHLPEHFGGVLFIENQDTYAAAIDGFPAEVSGLTLVYMSGFRGAAARIRSREGAALHFSGAGAAMGAQAFSAWWFLEQEAPWSLAFWGDLDFAGMQILKALRLRFSQTMAWQPGYARMLDDLQRLGAHTREGESGQIDPMTTGCPYADDVLLPAIRAWGFRDQESIGT